jgi:hypothetical protein
LNLENVPLLPNVRSCIWPPALTLMNISPGDRGLGVCALAAEAPIPNSRAAITTVRLVFFVIDLLVILAGLFTMPRSRTTRSGQCSRTKQNHVFKELRDTQARKALVSYHDCKSATMGDFELRSDAINVEDVMEQIRARIRDKRGVDYTEQQIRELAAVKLETFLDSRSVRSDLLKEFRAARPSQLFVPFGPDPLFTARRPIIARLRNLLRPVLRLFFNPDPIAEAFARVNLLAELHVAERDQYFELLHNLVLELTRTTIDNAENGCKSFPAWFQPSFVRGWGTRVDCPTCVAIVTRLCQLPFEIPIDPFDHGPRQVVFASQECCVRQGLSPQGRGSHPHRDQRYDEPPRPREIIAAAHRRGIGVMGIRAVQAGALTAAAAAVTGKLTHPRELMQEAPCVLNA